MSLLHPQRRLAKNAEPRLLFAADAVKFSVVFFLVHEPAGFLIALGPVLFALDLGLELGALADGSVAVSVAGGWVRRHGRSPSRYRLNANQSAMFRGNCDRGMPFSQAMSKSPKTERRPQAQPAGPDAMNCTLCKDVGWVRANHPDKPFHSRSGGCECGGGVPCPACNFTDDEKPGRQRDRVMANPTRNKI